MNVQFKVSDAAIEKLIESVKKSITKITEDVAIQTYNLIVANERQYPYWTGSYISSWNIQAGTPNTDYNLSNDPNTETFPIPDIKYQLEGINFGEWVYITNAVPHAYLVEYMGTPTHEHEGWFTATHAVNQTVMTYKYIPH